LGKAAASLRTPDCGWALLFVRDFRGEHDIAGDGLSSWGDASATGLGALFLGEFQDYFDVAAAVEAGNGSRG
jgi:hypothetical protein